MFEAQRTVVIDEDLLESGITVGTVKGTYTNPILSTGGEILLVEVGVESYEYDVVTELCKVCDRGLYKDAIVTESVEAFIVHEDERSGSVEAMYRLADAVLEGKASVTSKGDIFIAGGMHTGDQVSEYHSVLDDETMSFSQMQAYQAAHPLTRVMLGDDAYGDIMDMVNISADVGAAWDKGNETLTAMMEHNRHGVVVAVTDSDDGTLDIYEGIHIGHRQDAHGRIEHIALLRDQIVEYYDDPRIVIPVAAETYPYSDMINIERGFGFTPDDKLMGLAGQLKLVAESINDQSMLNHIGQETSILGIELGH